MQMINLFELTPGAKSLGVGTELYDPLSRPVNAANGLAQDFFSVFKTYMGEVNNRQFHAEDMARALAAGDIQDVHEVALAVSKAKFTIDMTVQLRDKILSAYDTLQQMR